MIEEQEEKIEQNLGIVIADIFKDELDYMIDNKEKYIAEFTEEKEKWESMSEGERENKIELEALLKEKSSAYPESYLKRIQYEDVYNTVSDDTREAIDVVHEMIGKQLYKKNEIKQNMYSLFAGSAVFGTIAGLYEGIVEQSLSAGGEALAAGGAFGLALSGLLVAGTKGIGAIKARKIIKQYPEAVKLSSFLNIPSQLSSCLNIIVGCNVSTKRNTSSSINLTFSRLFSTNCSKKAIFSRVEVVS